MAENTVYTAVMKPHVAEQLRLHVLHKHPDLDLPSFLKVQFPSGDSGIFASRNENNFGFQIILWGLNLRFRGSFHSPDIFRIHGMDWLHPGEFERSAFHTQFLCGVWKFVEENDELIAWASRERRWSEQEQRQWAKEQIPFPDRYFSESWKVWGKLLQRQRTELKELANNAQYSYDNIQFYSSTTDVAFKLGNPTFCTQPSGQRIRLKTAQSENDLMFGDVRYYDAQTQLLFVSPLDETKWQALRNNRDLFKKGTIHFDYSGDFVSLRRQDEAYERFVTGRTPNPNLLTLIPSAERASFFDNLYSDFPNGQFSPLVLTESQKKSILMALNARDVAFIQGPPGTGKTTVIAEIVCQAVALGMRALVTAQSNLAVDNALEMIAKQNKSDARCVRWTPPGVPTIVKDLLLSSLVDNWKREVGLRVRRSLMMNYVSISELEKSLNENRARYKQLNDAAELIRKTVNNIVTTTKELEQEVQQMKITENRLISSKLELNRLITTLGIPESTSEPELLSIFDEYDHFDYLTTKIATAMAKNSMWCNQLDKAVDLEAKLKQVIPQPSYTQSNSGEDHTVGGAAIGGAIGAALGGPLGAIIGGVIGGFLGSGGSGKTTRPVDSPSFETTRNRNEFESLCNGIKSSLSLATLPPLSDLVIKAKSVKDLETKLGQFCRNQVPTVRFIQDLQSSFRAIESAQKELSSRQPRIQAFEENIIRLQTSIHNIARGANIEPISNIDDTNSLLTKSINDTQAKINELELQIKVYKAIHDNIELLRDYGEKLPTASFLEELYLKQVNVVGATTSAIASNACPDSIQRLYDICVIDEAARCLPTELLIPMSRSQKVILVGDHQQLPPTVDEKLQRVLDSLESTGEDELKNEFEQSLFQRLFSSTSQCSIRLDVQFRMHPQIAYFISNYFYDSVLADGVTNDDRKHGLDEDPLFLDKHIVWISTADRDKRRETRRGTSFENSCEVDQIRKLLLRFEERLSKNSESSHTVGIISPYKAQIALLDGLLNKDHNRQFPHLNVEVGTVDSFQGRQKDYIILSLVRSNTKGQLGFVAHNERLNVALSRARQLLVIIGDHEFASNEVRRQIVLAQIAREMESKQLIMASWRLDE